MIYLQGTIGYTIFTNNETNKKIIVFSDMHDDLPPCPFTNSIKISKWFENKFKTSKLLLEEVIRTKDMELESLWDTSEHTNDLKILFLNNQNNIEAVDIRPSLISFSWEIVEKSENKHIKLKKYFNEIVNFFNLKSDFMQNKLYIINNIILKHFNKIRKKFYNYLITNKYLLNKTILHIYINHQNILEDFNIILNDCMEWYICILIEIYKKKTIMIHAGLYHTEKVNKLLKFFYNHNEIYKRGINYLNDSIRDKYLCQPINNNFI